MHVKFINCHENAGFYAIFDIFARELLHTDGGYYLEPWCLAPDLQADSLLLVQEIREQAGVQLAVSSLYQADRRVKQIAESVPASQLLQELKRQAYFLMSDLTGLKMPFGSLVGVRPTEFCRKLLAQNQGNRVLSQTQLTTLYGVSERKAQKLLRVCAREEELLAELPAQASLIYIGVPYCPGRCSYCSFIARDASRHAADLSAYAQALAREIRESLAAIQQPISAIYMGGGTPTTLSTADLDLVLASLEQALGPLTQYEFTLEAGRPDTVDREKLELIRSYGLERICLNPQSFKDKTLERVGRRHSVADIYRSFDLARSLGFKDINMDLIMGLPGEEPADFLYSVGEALALQADSITLHALALKRSAFLLGKNKQKLAVYKGELNAQDMWIDCLEEAEHALEAHNYEPYYLYRQKRALSGLENTGFAQNNKACLYNVGMMSDRREVIGMGSGSSSKHFQEEKLKRLYNTKDIGDYLARIDEVIAKKIAFFQE